MTFQPGQSGNPAGRPKGSVNKQLAMLREAVEKVLPLVVDRALAGDAEAQKLILEKGLPKLRAIDPPIEFIFPETGTAEIAQAVLLHVADGVLPLSYARGIVNALIPAAKQEQQFVGNSQCSAEVFTNAYLHRLLNG